MNNCFRESENYRKRIKDNLSYSPNLKNKVSTLPLQMDIENRIKKYKQDDHTKLDTEEQELSKYNEMLNTINNELQKSKNFDSKVFIKECFLPLKNKSENNSKNNFLSKSLIRTSEESNKNILKSSLKKKNLSLFKSIIKKDHNEFQKLKSKYKSLFLENEKLKLENKQFKKEIKKLSYENSKIISEFEKILIKKSKNQDKLISLNNYKKNKIICLEQKNLEMNKKLNELKFATLLVKPQDDLSIQSNFNDLIHCNNSLKTNSQILYSKLFYTKMSLNEHISFIDLIKLKLEMISSANFKLDKKKHILDSLINYIVKVIEEIKEFRLK